MKLQEKLQLIENTENAIDQTKDKLNTLLKPISSATLDILERKDFLDILESKADATIKIKAWSQDGVLCDIVLSDNELFALKNIIEQSINTMLEDVDFLKIADLHRKLTEINR